MRCLLRSTVTASLCLASRAFHTRQNVYEGSEDILSSGLYSIQGCGSNTSSIAAILDLLPPYLEPAITDTRSTRTSPAYNTFFKDVNHAPFVRKILQNIAHGTPVLPGLAQPGFNKVTSPVIACIPIPPLSNPSPSLVGLTPWVQAFAKEDCARYRGGPVTYGIHIGGTNIVILCPGWFSLDVPVKPKSQKPCLDVDRASNEFQGLGYPLARNRRAWLLHELAHVYIVAATNRREPVHEVYATNDCFRLKADAQRYMPNNYVYYAGNVYYKCTSFPTVSFRDRELSTSLSNTTADAVEANRTLSIAKLP